jgi:hypothetical protein
MRKLQIVIDKRQTDEFKLEETDIETYLSALLKTFKNKHKAITYIQLTKVNTYLMQMKLK